MPTSSISLLVCINQRLNPSSVSCGEGGEQLIPQLQAALDSAGLPDIAIETIDCFGLCELGPNVRLAPGGQFFHAVDEASISDIVAAVKDQLP